MKKSIFKILLFSAFIVILSVFLASCESSDGKLSYKKVKGGYAVVALEDSSLENVEIPESYKNKDVVEIADNAFYGKKIKSVSIPSTIINVGNQAFAYCERLESVNVSDIDAFAKINFTQPESNPLYYAHKLVVGGEEKETVKINTEDIGSYSFAGCENIANIELVNAKNIGDGAFYNAAGLIEISLPDSLKSIGRSAFAGCSSLLSVEIPDSVNSISHSVFASCTSLESVKLTSSINEIPERAFLECEALKTIEIPEKVLTVGAYAFYGCYSLDNITINAKITEILDYAFFNCQSLKNITLEEGSNLRSIGKNAFRGCYSIEEFSLLNADELTLIDESAFHFCTSLKNIYIPSSLKTLGDHAFSGCSSLELYTYLGIGYIGNEEKPKMILIDVTDVTITKAKVSYETSFIASGALERCTSLEEVTIYTHTDTGEGVINVGCNAFAFCPKLQKITFGKSVQTIGDNALMGCKQLSKIVYSGKGDEWKKVTRGTNWLYGAGTNTITYSSSS